MIAPDHYATEVNDPDVVDLYLYPLSWLQDGARTLASTLRVYGSSLPGALTLFMRRGDHISGLRIDVRQARLLRDALDRWIAKEEAK